MALLWNFDLVFWDTPWYIPIPRFLGEALSQWQ